METERGRFGYSDLPGWVALAAGGPLWFADLLPLNPAVLRTYAQYGSISTRLLDNPAGTALAWMEWGLKQADELLTACLHAWDIESPKSHRLGAADSLRTVPDIPEHATSPEVADSSAAYAYTNAKGHTYYLHERVVPLRGGGRQQPIYYFALQPGVGALGSIPLGMKVVEAAGSGMPLLKKM